ncbi:hypothetical protein BG015_002708 [Linnemannia schmuckeri]|uniref:Major facilitator superfamily (MFS) profile domain-containing protein n=1 Tax=Linnemannia schmuckeri TaxID=64567 RepID=A0A9P5RRM8_9FUNG|nr:hypothetical protein BG015_002708 [Linnemannia schmuckeri]
MDSSMQEFYSLSRSTSQQRPLTQIVSSQGDHDSRSPSRQQPARERPQSAVAWSQYQHPMTVPSIAQVWIQPNQQQQHLNLQDSCQQNPSPRRRRHHTAGSSGFESAPAGTGAASPAKRRSSAAVDDNDSIPYDPFAPSSPQPSPPLPVPSTPVSSYAGYSSLHPPHPSHDPSIYSQDDAHSRRHEYDYPHLGHLEELDDYDTYSEDNRGRRRSYPGGETSACENGQGGGEDQDDMSSIHYPPAPVAPTPLPKIPIFVLGVVIFSEPLTSTILDFHITENEDEIGFFCGLIASSFFFAQFCTSIFWGYMSDRYGRRPILLLGLCGSSIACIFFGLSKSLAWAIISRSMCGLLNGNVGVAKSMLGEIADASNQSQAFSLFGFAWGIGMIVGPFLGGYLANPAQTFPEIFGDWEFFIEYPYFLPCFIASMGGVTGFTVGYFFLKETKGMRGGVLVETNKDVDDDYYRSNNANNNQYQGGPDYQTFECDDLDSNGQDEPLSDFSGNHKTTDREVDTSNGATELDIDLERQPLMLPPNATQAQQVKFPKRRGMDHSNQYGSMATLTFDTGPSSVQSHPLQQHSYATPSARSTLSRRPVSVRPRLSHQSSSVSDIGLARLSSSCVDRPLSAVHPSIYAYNRPISTGQLLSMAEAPSGHRQRMEAIPADAVSLSHYGYTIDPAYLDGRVRVSSFNPGRQSRLSVAPSQVFVLPPDPNNKDPNQPVQLLVVQQAPEAGLSPLSITTIVAYAMLALHSIVFEEVYALYAVTPVVSHGLGWTAIQLSTSLACMGIVQLMMQFVVYPMLERRFSAVWLFRCAQLLYCCVYISFPLIRALAVDESDTETGGQLTRVRYLVLTTLVFKYLCSVFSYTSVMVMVYHKLIATTPTRNRKRDRPDICLIHASIRSSARSFSIPTELGRKKF